MIGVDTNIIVRVLVKEHTQETSAAIDFMSQRSSDDPAFVSVIVLVELAWVLERSYNFDDAAIFAALEMLFESANIVIERPALVLDAVAEARSGKTDFADCMIAALAADAGCVRVMTFDKKAARRIPGMELLA